MHNSPVAQDHLRILDKWGWINNFLFFLGGGQVDWGEEGNLHLSFLFRPHPPHLLYFLCACQCAWGFAPGGGGCLWMGKGAENVKPWCSNTLSKSNSQFHIPIVLQSKFFDLPFSICDTVNKPDKYFRWKQMNFDHPKKQKQEAIKLN